MKANRTIEETMAEHPEEIYDFDWATVYSDLDGADPEETEANYKRMGQALQSILDWVLSVDLTSPTACKLIGRRVLALVWSLDPSRFQDASVRKLAEQIGVAAPALSKIAANASRDFHITNAFKGHDWKNN